MIHVSLSSSSSSFEKLFRQPKKHAIINDDVTEIHHAYDDFLKFIVSIRFNSMECAFDSKHLFCFGLVSDGIGFSYP